MNHKSFHWLFLLLALGPLQLGCNVRARMTKMGLTRAAPKLDDDAADAPTIADAPAAPRLESDNDRLLYLFGRQLGDSIDHSLTLRPNELSAVQAGLSDRLRGVQSPISAADYDSMLAALLANRSAEHLLAEKRRAHETLDKAAHEAGALRSPSGIVYQPLAAGSGRSPELNDTVEAQLLLKGDDQSVVDDTRRDGHPARLVIGHTVPCLSEGLQLMRQGGKARLVCPSELAYGDASELPKVPGGAAVTFEVELLAVHSAAGAARPVQAAHVKGRAGRR